MIIYLLISLGQDIEESVLKNDLSSGFEESKRKHELTNINDKRK